VTDLFSQLTPSIGLSTILMLLKIQKQSSQALPIAVNQEVALKIWKDYLIFLLLPNSLIIARLRLHHFIVIMGKWNGINEFDYT